jgi:hypothetical protein
MDRTLISWNFPNWFTVMLMAAGGYAILVVMKQLFIKGGASTVAGAGGF